MIRFQGCIAFSAILFAAGVAQAADQAPISLTLKDHHFTPSVVSVPADTAFTVMVKNEDPTPAEFESDDFSAEKVVPAGGEVKIEIAPLKAGTYEFHDEYNEDESKSQIVVK